MPEGFTRIGGELFVTTAGNAILPDVVDMQSLYAAIRAVYSQEKTGETFERLTRTHFDFPIFAEIDGVLYTWLNDGRGWLFGPPKPWAEGLIMIEEIVRDDSGIAGFTVVVNASAYYRLPIHGAMYTHLLRKEFIIEPDGVKLHRNERAYDVDTAPFENFITLMSFAREFFDGYGSGYVLFGRDGCDAAAQMIDRAIAAGKRIYYYDVTLFWDEQAATEWVYERFGINNLPALIYIP